MNPETPVGRGWEQASAVQPPVRPGQYDPVILAQEAQDRATSVPSEPVEAQAARLQQEMKAVAISMKHDGHKPGSKEYKILQEVLQDLTNKLIALQQR